MNNELRCNRFHVSSVQVRVLDVVQKCVAPVQSVGGQVDGQPIRPAERQVFENLPARTVRESSADVCRSVPLREENVPAF